MTSRRPLCLALALSALGCTGLGPSVVRNTHGNYNRSIVKVLDEQLLLNLVRLRYRDNPYFVEIGSVTSSAFIGGSAGISGDLPPVTAEKSVLHPNLGTSWSVTPTVVFTPLQGENFFRKLITPLSLPALTYLTQSGWSIARVLDLVVDRINDLQNASSASGPTPHVPPPYEGFRQFAAELRDLQKADQVSMGIEPADRDNQVWIEFRPSVDRSVNARLGELLGLDMNLRRYAVTTDFLRRDPGRVAMRLRSVLGVMFFLSQGVRPPEEHARQGLITITRRPDGGAFEWGDVLKNVFVVRSSDSEPDAAAVKVRYRDAWFYIADDDLDSKSTFMLLTELFNLQAGAVEGFVAPALTLPLR